MSKLTDREIVRLHQMSSSGATNIELATEFGIHRNTVSRHLLLRFRYSNYVLNTLCLNAPLPSGRSLKIYDAAAYLPGWPSDARVYRLYKHGILSARLRPQVGRSGVVLYSRMSEIRKAALTMLPAGLWVRSDTFEHYCQRAFEALCRCDHLSRHCTYWPSREYKYYPAPELFEAARQIDTTVRVPLPIRRRAAVCLATVSVATI